MRGFDAAWARRRAGGRGTSAWRTRHGASDTYCGLARMRILQIDKFLDAAGARAGGVGTHVRSLTSRLRRRGHEVLQFGCVDSDRPGAMPRFFDFTATRCPLALVRMIHNREAAAKLDAFLRRRPVDVAHVHNIYHHLTPSILPVLASRGAAIVMTVHDYRLACPAKHFLSATGVCMRCLPNRFYHAALHCDGAGGVGLAVESYVQRFFRRYFRWVERFLCPSIFLRGVLRRAGADRHRLRVVRNPAEPVPLPADVPQGASELLFAGRLSWEKGPDLMLDLARRLPAARITIAGDGPLREGLRRGIGRGGLNNVRPAGHLGREELARLYARAAAVVVPSRCPENSPATLLEAMAAGRCVVAADHPPIREWVRDGATGRLFPPGNGEALARVCAELLADAPGRNRMAATGRDIVRRCHDPEAIVSQVEALYEEALAQCGSR